MLNASFHICRGMGARAVPAGDGTVASQEEQLEAQVGNAKLGSWLGGKLLGESVLRFASYTAIVPFSLCAKGAKRLRSHYAQADSLSLPPFLLRFHKTESYQKEGKTSVMKKQSELNEAHRRVLEKEVEEGRKWKEREEMAVIVERSRKER